MATVEFQNNGNKIIVQCNKSDKMKQLFQKFYYKSELNTNSCIFLYNGQNITDNESTFEQLANQEDKNRNKMNILVYESSNDSSSASDFIIETSNGEVDQSMKDYAKTTILSSIEKYPSNDYNKCALIKEKFEEKYGGVWGCCYFKEGDCIITNLICIKIKFNGHIIKIFKTNQ